MKSLTLKLLVINIIVMLTFAVLFLYQTYTRTEESIRHLVDQQASLALQFDLSIRQYMADHIRPAMYELTGEDEFHPETMSTSYIARAIFEDVRQRFPDYIIKFSSADPRNPLNLAGPEELKVIDMFNRQPDLDQWKGKVVIDGKKYLAKFSARRMTSSCSRCHDRPEDAPASLIARYGDKAGFYKKRGDIIGLDTVAIPMTTIIEHQKSAFFKASLYSGVGIFLFFAVTFLITRHLIIRRLVTISDHFQAVSQETDYRRMEPLEVTGNDEISDLAISFNTLSLRLKKFYAFLNDQVDQRTSELKKEIGEHKRAEDRLRQSEERFRLAFQTSPNIITLTRVEDGTYIDINDAFTKALGYPRDEVIGRSDLALDIWEDVKDREKLVAELKTSGIVECLETRFKGREGQIIEGIMSARILFVEDETFLLATTQDITRIKQSERERLNLEIQLQQAHKMEAIGTLAGGIAHDFNNILAGIFGYTQLAQAHMEKPEQASKYMNQVLTGAKRAAGLVQQILTFSRKADYQKNPVDICQEIQQALKLLRPSIPSTIEFNIGLKSKARVLGDATKIHQVVMNLCTNAYHAMRETGGILTLSTEDIKITRPEVRMDKTLIPGDYILLKIRDTGHGMDKETVKKATEPYFTTKGPGQGTGLGLALVKAIVDEHDGFLDIQTQPRKGTCFSIYLPATSEQEISHKTSTRAEEGNVRGVERIMVVDDEEAIRDLLKNYLENHGYQVSSFPNGLDALRAFESDPGRYDLIVTDMSMPKLSGKELAQEIFKRKAGFPVIICTGYSEQITEAQAADLGIRKFIQKPFENQRIVSEIRKILDEPAP